MGRPDYPKKRRISKRTVTTRLYTDDEREVQRRVTNEGKDRSEIIRQAISNAFRTERLALSRKDETMQPVIDTYRKFMDEATETMRYNLWRMHSEVERMWLETRKAFAGMKAMSENIETIACASRYNTEQAIVIRALMQLYMFNVHQEIEMQCGLNAPLLKQEFEERLTEFRHAAGNEMAQVMEDSASPKNQAVAEEVVNKLSKWLETPLEAEKRAALMKREDEMMKREPRW